MIFKPDKTKIKYFIEFNNKREYLNIGNQVLGRGENSDIIIGDNSVSTSHLLIYFFNGIVQIMDLNSKNGTIVNNERINNFIFIEIKPNTRITLGNITLTYNIEEEKNLTKDLENYCQGTISVLAKYDPSDFSKEVLESEEIDYSKLQETNKKLSFLYSFGQRISNIFDLKNLFDILLEELNNLFPMSSRAIIFLGNEKTLKAKSFWENGKEVLAENIEYSQTIINLAINEKKAFIVSDFGNSSTELTKSIIALNLKCTMIAPFLSENKLIGMILIDSTKSISVFNNEDLKLLSGICNLISVKIINKRLLNRVNKQALDLKASNEKLEENNIEMKKAKEEAEKANILKSKFLGNISHELRTPLNSILGFSNLLKKYKDETINNYAERINRNGNRLIKLINDITELSLIDTEYTENKITTFNIRNLISIKEELKNKINNKDIKINFRYSPNFPEKISTDLNKLNKIFTNLLDNSVKYTQKGFINVYFLVNNNNENELILKIEDTGIGIPESEINNIFEALYQVNGEKQEVKSSGLGLTIAKMLAKRLEGDISVVSELGKGSSFTFTFKNYNIEKKEENIKNENNSTENNPIILENLEKISKMRFFESSKINRELEELLKISNTSTNIKINEIISNLKDKKEIEYKDSLSKLINKLK